MTIYDDNGLASLESAVDVLSAKDPDAELFVLVDEYDRFSTELMVASDSSRYDAVVAAGTPGKESDPLHAFLTAIKSLSGILPTRSFVTGVTPISLADSSSANIYKSISFGQSVASVFGFTEVDVNAGLPQLKQLSDDERKTAFDFMTAFFNGHLYYPTKDEACKLYNPQLSLKFFKILCTDEGPQLLRDWRDGRTSIEDLVARVDDPNTRVSESALALLAKSPLTLQDIALLTAGGSIETKLSLIKMPFKLYEMMQLPSEDDESLSYLQRCRMLTFMFAHGIVTIDQSRVDEDNLDAVYLQVPNEVVRHKLLQSIESRLQSKVDANDFLATFQTPTEDSLTTYFEKILDPMGILLDNNFPEPGVQAIFEATLREARSSAGAGYIDCEGKRQHAGPSGGTGYSDLLVVLGDVAVLVELKRVRPNAVCNLENKAKHDGLKPFSSDVQWRRNRIAEFGGFIATLELGDLDDITVYFDEPRMNKNLATNGRFGDRELSVGDHHDIAASQLEKCKTSAAEYVKKFDVKKCRTPTLAFYIRAAEP